MEDRIMNNNIPLGWSKFLLGSLGEIVTGNTPPTKDRANYIGDHYWATAEDFNSKYIFHTKITLSDVGKKYARFVPIGAVLVTCIASIGKNAITKVPISTNQQINAIVVNSKNNNEFVYYWIQNSTSLLKRMAGAGAMQILNKNEFSRLEINLPPLSEQNRITAVLETWDKALEKLTRKIEIKNQIKKSLMQELLTGKKRLSGFHNKWKIEKLGMISDLITKGTTPTTNGFSYQEEGIRFIKIESITEQGGLLENKCAYISNQAHDALKRSQLQEGDILFSIAGALGRTFMVSNRCLPSNINQALAVIRLKNNDNVSRQFIYFYLRSQSIKTWVREINVQMAQANISLGDLSNLKLKFPPIKEQTAIANILTAADAEIILLEKKLTLFKDQKKYLLNNLITGTIRTPENLTIHT